MKTTFYSLALLAALPLSGADRILFDFESGKYDGWTYEGNAIKPTFGAAPFDATEVKSWRNDRDFTGWHGRYLVKVGDTRHETVSPGRLVSDEFEITHPYLKFRLGGEVHPDVKVALLSDGKEVRTAFCNNSYDMRLRGWDVRELKGKRAKLVVQDTADVASLLRVDYFHLSDTPPPAPGNFDASEQESDIVRYGEFTHLVRPPAGKYFDYATVVRGPDRRWHIFAAQALIKDRWTPGNHKEIVHASAAALAGPWQFHGTVMTADAAFGEDFLWQPYALVHEGRFHLFYVGSGKPWSGWDKNNNWRAKDFGPKSTQGPFGIHLATSVDGVNWERAKKGPLFTDNPFAFTPFVMKSGSEWLMYYGGAEPADIMGKHAILARTSKDLREWTNRRVVMADVTDTSPWPEHSFFHDPFVYSRNGAFYLMAGPINNTNQARYHYRRIYRSGDPLKFEMTADYKGIFVEGGPKFIEEGGKTYVYHTGQWAGGVWIAPVAFRKPGDPSWEKRRMTVKTLRDKVRGGWAGQMIGVSYGARTEFKSNGRINEQELDWSPERVSNALGQDDLYVEMTFAHAMDAHGIDAPVERYAEAFKNAQYQLWHANASGRRNLQRGMEPRMAGHPRYNLHANDIDFQIEADFIGLMAPGLPKQATRLCDRIGRLVNYGDGLYGGMFMAGMYSAAFFETDPRKVVEAGLAAIPAGSQYAALIRDLLGWQRANPSDWRAVWKQLQDKWDRNDPCPKGALDPYNIDAKLNGGYVALGLLYGGGDFERTIDISTRAGQDSDCNPSTAGGILGVMLGYGGIPDRWKSGLGAIASKKFSYTDYSFDEITESTVARAIKLVQAAGGVHFGTSELEIPVEAPEPPALEQWDPGVPAERIAATEPRWSWKGEWKAGERGRITTAAGSEAAISFEGRGVALVGPYTTDGGKADIYLDGRKVASIDANAAPRTSDIDLWHDTELKRGKHSLRVVTTGGRIELMRAIVYR